MSEDKKISTVRKTAIFYKKLAASNKRSRDNTMGLRSRNSFSRDTNTTTFTTSSKNECGTNVPDRSGNRSYVGEGCHSESHSPKRGILQQPVSCIQKGWGQQASDQSEKFECFRPIPTFQNGGVAFSERDVAGERFYVQNRLERCLLLHSTSSEIPKVYPFHVERQPIRISLSLFRARSSTMDLHKTIEDTN